MDGVDVLDAVGCEQLNVIDGDGSGVAAPAPRSHLLLWRRIQTEGTI